VFKILRFAGYGLLAVSLIAAVAPWWPVFQEGRTGAPYRAWLNDNVQRLDPTAADGGLDGPALEPSRYYGQHGFLASHDEVCGVLFARGAGIKKKRFGEVEAIAVKKGSSPEELFKDEDFA